MKIIAFGPEFDDQAFEQNGHLRVDLGLDTPWIIPGEEDDEDPDETLYADEEAKAGGGALYQGECRDAAGLYALGRTPLRVQSRLLWTESGEPLAEKLIARLQRLN